MNKLMVGLLFAVLETSAFAYYMPGPGRWLSRDPIGEEAFFSSYTFGKSPNETESLLAESYKPLYLFVGNNPVSWIDRLGLDRAIMLTGLHAFVMVDTWDADSGCCVKTGRVRIEFLPTSNWYEILSLTGMSVPGQVRIERSSGGGWVGVHIL